MRSNPSPNLPLRGTMAEILGGIDPGPAEAGSGASPARARPLRLGPDWVAEDLPRIEHALARLEAALAGAQR